MVRAGVLATSIALLASLPATAAPSRPAARRAPSVRPARSIGRAHITVTPTSGSPTTRFTVRFRAPERTGRFGSSRRAYVLSAAAAGGCASVYVYLRASRAHVLRKVTLDPKALHERWCVGTYRGQVEETQTPICPKGHACPALVVLLGTVGRFSFHITAPTTTPQNPHPSPSTGDHTPPTFAGLDSASACTPGPQRPGQTTPFTLNWQPARDAVTPTTQIVYDIFATTTAAAEDYVKPTWTTAPGATSFRTPGLASHGTFYFVVRARDQAGNEDQNTVERRGIDPCL